MSLKLSFSILRINGHLFAGGNKCVRCGRDLVGDLLGYGSNAPICLGHEINSMTKQEVARRIIASAKAAGETGT